MSFLNTKIICIAAIAFTFIYCISDFQSRFQSPTYNTPKPPQLDKLDSLSLSVLDSEDKKIIEDVFRQQWYKAKKNTALPDSNVTANPNDVNLVTPDGAIQTMYLGDTEVKLKAVIKVKGASDYALLQVKNMKTKNVDVIKIFSREEYEGFKLMITSPSSIKLSRTRNDQLQVIDLTMYQRG